MQARLGKDSIASLTEDALKDIIKRLWATLFWGNKDYKANRVLSDNASSEKSGLETMRDALAELLYGSAPFPKRYDVFRKQVKGLGTVSLTEILHFAEPTQYCLWNDKPQNVLPFLGMSNMLPERVFRYPNSMTGQEYVQCCEVIGLIRDELTANGIASADFTGADCFLWYLFDQVLPQQKPEPAKPELPTSPAPVSAMSITTHSDAQTILLKLGNLLGYDAYVADPSQTSNGQKLGDLATLKELPPFTLPPILDSARYIDMIWLKDEFSECCFEVEHTTDVTKGLLGLYQIHQLGHVKFFIVAPVDKIGKFQTEVSKDPSNQIKSRYLFRTYEELCAFYELAAKYHELKSGFFGAST